MTDTISRGAGRAVNDSRSRARPAPPPPSGRGRPGEQLVLPFALPAPVPVANPPATTPDGARDHAGEGRR